MRTQRWSVPRSAHAGTRIPSKHLEATCRPMPPIPPLFHTGTLGEVVVVVIGTHNKLTRCLDRSLRVAHLITTGWCGMEWRPMARVDRTVDRAAPRCTDSMKASRYRFARASLDALPSV